MDTFVEHLNKSMEKANVFNNIQQDNTLSSNIFKYNDVNMKISISLNDVIMFNTTTGLDVTEQPNTNETITYTSTFVFYEFGEQTYKDKKLGWFIGSRFNEIYYNHTTKRWSGINDVLNGIIPIIINTEINVNDYDYTCESIASVKGTRNIYVSVTDYTNNIDSNNLITIQNTPNVEGNVKMYDYAVYGYINKNLVATTDIDDLVITKDNEHSVLFYMDIRGKTKKQIEAINLTNRTNTMARTIIHSFAPSIQDLFMIIPVNKSNVNYGDNFEDNHISNDRGMVRNYIGNVNINRIKCVLYDDWGNIINLNGADWSINFIAKSKH
jgi:hypothetical protein